MMSVEQRYMNDAQFHALVDFMVSNIREYKYTPSEMREAAMFACVKVEMTRTPESMVALRYPSPNNKRDVIRYEENHPCSFCDNYSVCKLKINPIPCFRRSELTPIL